MKPAVSKREILLHLSLIFGVALLLILSFFYVYLPRTTHHGQTITVPNLIGKHMDELPEFLEVRELDFKVDDSSFVPNMAPFTIYQQYPLAGAQVKQFRKIYVSIYAKNPPSVNMPNLVNRSFINAQRELESFGLLLGNIRYVPDIQQSSVLKQQINGRDIVAGTSIVKGTKIDLEVGDGLGNQEFEVPNLTGKPLDEATVALQGSGLQIGVIIYEMNEDMPEGSIIKQKPVAGFKIRVGDVVDVWVSGNDPANYPINENE